MTFSSTPRLPRALLHLLKVIKRTYVNDQECGGQSVPNDETIETFWGIVLPMTNEDWKQLPEGSYTQDSQKLYTDDDIVIAPGHIIQDTFNGQCYTAKHKLSHNTIHPMLRYLVEGVVEK